MLQVEIDQNLEKNKNFIYFDLIWPPVVEIDLQTTKFLHFWNQGAIFNQKKYHIDIKGNFNFWPSYEMFQSSRPRTLNFSVYQKLTFQWKLNFLKNKKVNKDRIWQPNVKSIISFENTGFQLFQWNKFFLKKSFNFQCSTNFTDSLTFI
jgi:hypothetical protein